MTPHHFVTLQELGDAESFYDDVGDGGEPPDCIIEVCGMERQEAITTLAVWSPHQKRPATPAHQLLHRQRQAVLAAGASWIELELDRLRWELRKAAPVVPPSGEDMREVY